MLTEPPSVYEPAFACNALTDDAIAEMNEALLAVSQPGDELDEDDIQYIARMNRIDIEEADRDLALAALVECVPATAVISLQKATVWLHTPQVAGLQRTDRWSATIDPMDGRAGAYGGGATPAEAVQAALAKFAGAARAA